MYSVLQCNVRMHRGRVGAAQVAWQQDGFYDDKGAVHMPTITQPIDNTTAYAKPVAHPCSSSRAHVRVCACVSACLRPRVRVRVRLRVCVHVFWERVGVDTGAS